MRLNVSCKITMGLLRKYKTISTFLFLSSHLKPYHILVWPALSWEVKEELMPTSQTALTIKFQLHEKLWHIKDVFPQRVPLNLINCSSVLHILKPTSQFKHTRLDCLNKDNYSLSPYPNNLPLQIDLHFVTWCQNEENCFKGAQGTQCIDTAFYTESAGSFLQQNNL